MRERDETLLVDLIAIRADRQPDLDVLTFERLSADGLPDEIRTYGDLHRNGQRIAAWLIARGLAPGERFALMMRNHPEFVETMMAASATACVMVPSVRKSGPVRDHRPIASTHASPGRSTST